MFIIIYYIFVCVVKIFEVLKFIHKQKTKKNIDKCIIYTNNNGDPSWTYLLKDYMEYKINAKEPLGTSTPHRRRRGPARG